MSSAPHFNSLHKQLHHIELFILHLVPPTHIMLMSSINIDQKHIYGR